MLVVIRCLPAVLMVDHDRLIRAIWVFADNPAVLRAVGEEFNIPLRFPYDGEAILPDQFFSLFVNIISPFWNFNGRLKDLTIAEQSLKRCAKSGNGATIAHGNRLKK